MSTTQLENRIDGLISELADIFCSILLLDHSSEELLDQRSSLKKGFYALNLKVKRLLHEQMTTPKLISGVCTRVKLPKKPFLLSTTIFQDCSSFWEQFGVLIHNKETVEDVKKLTSLRDALKYGSARHAI